LKRKKRLLAVKTAGEKGGSSLAIGGKAIVHRWEGSIKTRDHGHAKTEIPRIKEEGVFVLGGKSHSPDNNGVLSKRGGGEDL